MEDVDDSGKILHIKVPDMKTGTHRSFVISGNCYSVCKKYINLRREVKDPYVHDFFLNYQNGKCSKQVVGLNKFGSVPKQVAEYLKLENPAGFTGHCFRRTSATILVGAGGDLTSLKRQGGWCSSSTPEGIATGIPKSDIGAILGTASTGTTQLKRLNLEQPCTPSLEEVPRKIKRYIIPLGKEGVNIAKRSPASTIKISKAPGENPALGIAVLLRIEAKLDKALLEIKNVKSRLSSIEEKFDAEFGQRQFSKPDTYPIHSLQSFFDLEKNSSKGERDAQQKYLQTLDAQDIKTFVYLALKNSIADEVIKNHFTLHGSDSKIKLEGTEFLNMIYCAAQRCTHFEGPSCISELFPYIYNIYPYVGEDVRSAQIKEHSTKDSLQENNIIISPHYTYEGDHCTNENEKNEGHNYGTDDFDENELAFVKIEEESNFDEIDEKPNLFLD